MDDNVIKFEPKPRVYVLEFKTPAQIRMHKDSNCDIQLELRRDMDELVGSGTAWVPAMSKNQATRKLLDLLNATNIRFIGDGK